MMEPNNSKDGGGDKTSPVGVVDSIRRCLAGSFHGAIFASRFHEKNEEPSEKNEEPPEINPPVVHRLASSNSKQLLPSSQHQLKPPFDKSHKNAGTEDLHNQEDCDLLKWLIQLCQGQFLLGIGDGMTFEVLAGTILSIMNKVNDTVTEDEIVEQLEKNGISTDCHMKFVREICKHALDVRNNDRCTKDLLCAYLSKTRPTGAGGTIIPIG